MKTRLSAAVAACLVLALVLAEVPAQRKPPAKPPGPRVVAAGPLGLAPGTTNRLTLWGRELDAATGVKFADGKGTVKILKKGKSPVPNMRDANKVGDSFVEVEATLPADQPEGTVALVVITPKGETPPHKVVASKAAVMAEKEPNDGLKNAQPVKLPALVDGVVSRDQDVDVFRFEGKEGQKVRVEVLAARHGVPLDGFLTVYDSAGNVLASDDDSDGTDPKIELTLPKDGVYFASVIDARDQGGPSYVYRLVVRE